MLIGRVQLQKTRDDPRYNMMERAKKKKKIHKCVILSHNNTYQPQKNIILVLWLIFFSYKPIYVLNETMSRENNKPSLKKKATNTILAQIFISKVVLLLFL